WKMQTQFFDDSEHPDAKAAFVRAFDSWRCETRVNWEIGGTATATDVNGADNEHVIRFDNGFELEAGVLGTCYSQYVGRLCSDEVIWSVTDLDIVFDSETSWYFGTGTFDDGEYDFETVALHELGHGLQLGHVINSDNVMHYTILKNTTNTILDSNSIDVANDVQSRSSTNQICGFPVLNLTTDYAGDCTLEVESINMENGIDLFPIPAKKEFFIKNISSEKIERVVMFDVSGRLISEIDVSNTPTTKSINLENTSKGMYFVNIHSNNHFITKKLIVE
ncbi:T9SS type A sorting domain-containing protein, partial [Algibacter sp.]|uniref:T9SS type A sorting domain-containing protein n=1 Tax=Algibacter sp. TaxID=1872428 RepID=UPI003C70ADBA